MHSSDFSGSRAEYVSVRVRILSLLFAGLALVWIPVDIVFVPDEKLAVMLGLRLAYSILFLFLGLWSGDMQKPGKASLRVSVFVLINCLFYVSSVVVLGKESGIEGALVGYSFLPFLTVVLLAIFPLTLMEGISYIVLVLFTYIAGQLYLGIVNGINVLADVWLLLLLSGIVIWAQLSQLHMLLQLYREASRDPLTGLVNRRVLNKQLDMELGREGSRMLSVLLFDLDFFKRVNDTHGHLTGDKVLQTFSRLLRRDLSSTNLIGRYGGEEFIVVLTGKDGEHAMKIAERIRKHCHDVELWGPGGKQVRFTVSVGVTQMQSDDTIETLIHRADKALYAAKVDGRDRVVIA